jgi:NAD(P)-dependent dehydrogenase (short-subunit alcohol dehydrogenase family)
MTILDKFNLKDRVAIVTGGGGQLGFEFCKTLAEAGASVVAADLNMDLASKTDSPHGLWLFCDGFPS